MSEERIMDVCKRDHLDLMIRYGEKKKESILSSLENGTPFNTRDKRDKILGDALMMLISKRDHFLDAEILGDLVITQRINALLDDATKQNATLQEMIEKVRNMDVRAVMMAA